MNVHLFGGVSSPSCSNFALRRAANDAENHVGRETADVLKKNFYVDDCLRLEESEEAAVQRISSVRSVCAAGGFKLGKFVSNRREVLVTVPQEERAQVVRTLDLTTDHLPRSAVGSGIRYAGIPNYSQGQTVYTKRHLVYHMFRVRSFGNSSTFPVSWEEAFTRSLSHEAWMG